MQIEMGLPPQTRVVIVKDGETLGYCLNCRITKNRHNVRILEVDRAVIIQEVVYQELINQAIDILVKNSSGDKIAEFYNCYIAEYSVMMHTPDQVCLENMRIILNEENWKPIKKSSLGALIVKNDIVIGYAECFNDTYPTAVNHLSSRRFEINNFYIDISLLSEDDEDFILEQSGKFFIFSAYIPKEKVNLREKIGRKVEESLEDIGWEQVSEVFFEQNQEEYNLRAGMYFLKNLYAIEEAKFTPIYTTIQYDSQGNQYYWDNTTGTSVTYTISYDTGAFDSSNTIFYPDDEY